MKAVRIHEHGGPEVLRYEDVPEPPIRPDQVLVRVRACSLNHLDLWVRGGLPGMRYSMPHILGSDLAGEVVQAGELCRRVKPGERVLVAPGWSCRQCARCFEGRDNECRDFAVLGNAIDGGNRELIPVPEYAAIAIPDDFGFEDAAAAPLVFLTAWHMLFARARLEAGEDVLVVAASSGVGMAAVQLARLFHCRVIATAGGDAKLAKAAQLGAHHVIDHYKQDVAAEVRRLTGRRGVDVVFEHAGAATWAKSVACLAPSGRLVTCGATSGHDVGIDLRFLFSKQYSILGSYMGTLGELHKVLRFVFARKVRPVIDSVYPMAEIRAAHQRMERREQFGKIVLVP
jgi:NADPH:quinone reductase-like Zn-dependent oxidoreductase